MRRAVRDPVARRRLARRVATTLALLALVGAASAVAAVGLRGSTHLRLEFATVDGVRSLTVVHPRWPLQLHEFRFPAGEVEAQAPARITLPAWRGPVPFGRLEGVELAPPPGRFVFRHDGHALAATADGIAIDGGAPRGWEIGAVVTFPLPPAAPAASPEPIPEPAGVSATR